MARPPERSSTPRVPAAGNLLISSVGIDSGYFTRSVVLVIDHDDSGTLGVVLNQFAEPRLDSVLPQWADLVSEPRVLFSGGPVSRNGAICLASPLADEEPPGYRPVVGRIGLLHLDTPVEIVAGAYADLRIFAGYAGWEAGQLAGELAMDMWWVVDARYDDVFGDRPEGLWQQCLRRQPGEIAFFSTWTDDPERN